jgi:hypothetical protein
VWHALASAPGIALPQDPTPADLLAPGLWRVIETVVMQAPGVRPDSAKAYLRGARNILRGCNAGAS